MKIVAPSQWDQTGQLTLAARRKYARRGSRLARCDSATARRRCARHCLRPGFTLIEVLLASLLCGVLLAALWSLLSMYLRLFETGQTKTEQSQLARTLMEQLADDLRSVPPPGRRDGLLAGGSTRRRLPFPPLGNPTGATPTAASPTDSQPRSLGTRPVRSVLRGTETSLELEIVQAASPQYGTAEETLDMRPNRSAHRADARELLGVRYTFEPPTFSDRPDPRARPGLTRREVDWATTQGDNSRNRQSLSDTTAASDGLVDRDDSVAIDSAAASFERDPMDASTLSVAPEVVGLKLRYFDGSAWLVSWDSASAGRLPGAVEVTMQVRSFDEPIEKSRVDVADKGSPRPNGDTEDPRRPTYRLVIHLPAGAAKASQSAIREQGTGELPAAATDQEPTSGSQTPASPMPAATKSEGAL